MARIDELRLMARVARMYYAGNLKQPEIAERLSLSQATISRLLKRAEREQIVRITVSVPVGAFPELEEGLETRFALNEAIVVDSLEDEENQIMRDLGAAAAYYVETTLRPDEVVGVAAYASLRAMVNAIQPRGRRMGQTAQAAPAGSTEQAGQTDQAGRTNPAEDQLGAQARVRVVQLTGGVGNPAAEQHATELTRQLAALVRGQPVFLPAPGLAPSAAAREVFLQDPFVREALAAFDRVTLALVGIAPVAGGGPGSFRNALTDEEKALLAEHGAVGFICHRFYDAQGAPVRTALDRRVTAITPDQLRRVDRTVGITGGPERTAAIRAALDGRWVNVLVTDRFTAERLLTQ